ncbi:MAG: alginate O-acetyltransferase AlgX-related protein [Fimbriimonas sp.]
MAMGTMIAALTAASMGFVDSRADVGKMAATADKAGKSFIAGKAGWFYFAPELRHLAAGKFWGAGGDRDPMPAIVDFNAQCKKAGVELILVPVPGKATIYPENLLGKRPSPSLDTMDKQFLGALKGQGVKVLDLTSKFQAGRNANVFCKQDTHWSGNGISIAADAIAKELKGRSWYGGVPKSKYAVKPTNVSAKGDLGELAGKGPETIRVYKVSGNVNPSRTSPVVLLGDSHNLIFSAGGDMISTGAGLPENLSAKLGFPVDLVAVRGSGATPARINLARRRDNLKGKKVVVWCFTTREFTEGQGWRKVPVVR